MDEKTFSTKAFIKKNVFHFLNFISEQEIDWDEGARVVLFVQSKCATYHLYQALQTVMQASSSALFKYLNTDTQTSFSPPFSLPTSLKDGRDSREGGDRE